MGQHTDEGVSPRFPLGRVVATPGAISTIERLGISAASLLERHVSGDWGDLDDDDKRENEYSVTRRLRLLSAYGPEGSDERLWIITEADRSVTTILRPEDY
jgi:hypothetical protein